MIVCHCKGVSDRAVRRAVAEGARTRGQVARRCGAGTVCGGCRPVIQELLAESTAAPETPCEQALPLTLAAAR